MQIDDNCDVSFDNSKGIATEQPFEIIQEIMRYIMPLRLFLPFTYRPLVHPAGHPRPKILPLLNVCKSWYLAGLPLLYRNLLITRCVQLERLLVTLENPANSAISSWIESIEIRDVIPKEISSSVFQNGIRALLQMCPNLTTYAYQSSFRHSKLPVYASSYPSLLPPITHLQLQWVLSPTELESALRETAGSLQSLHMSFTYMVEYKQWPAMSFTFPRLDTLLLPQTSAAVGICTGWNMPSLTRLLLYVDNSGPYREQQPIYLEGFRRRDLWGIDKEKGEAFFKKFGSTLKVLEIYRNDFLKRPGLDDQLVSQFLAHVPGLEHLILHLEHNSYHELPFNFWHFRHANVKYVDVWADESVAFTLQETLALGRLPLAPEVEWGSQMENRSDSTIPFPAARGFRIFPKTLGSWNHLPVVIPPSYAPLPRIMDFPPVREVVSWLDWLAAREHTDYNNCYATPTVDNFGAMLDTAQNEQDLDEDDDDDSSSEKSDGESDGNFEMVEEEDDSESSSDSVYSDVESEN
ncbi:hypothetical protein CVT24_008217 [Panaeolus cyanescens]|uniref:F-box domain-containing protein n=1 Tax=Panaeolus cyanescens TaxID=181874 RepID=A0A409VF22_9AGAR|nr:hypothetical protein CVT24_008217 [Panaeolus cyanescens]